MDWGEGAGFINESITEEPQQVTSNVQIGGDDKNKLVAAVSVSQISKLTRPNEGLIIHGKKVYHVNLVAYVYEILDINPTKIHLLVDDHSGGGPLEVSHILGDVTTPGEDTSMSMFQDHDDAVDNNAGGQTRDIHSIRTGDYIRCVGVVKFTQDKSNVIAYYIKIIEDPNEITLHIMEVIRDSMFYQKCQINGGILPVMKEDKPAVNNPQQQQQQQNQPQQTDFGKLSTRDKHVFSFLKAKAGANGIHIDEIAKNFTAFSKSEILDSLAMLSNEGLCWQSDDENVWLCEAL